MPGATTHAIPGCDHTHSSLSHSFSMEGRFTSISEVSSIDEDSKVAISYCSQRLYHQVLT